MKKTVAVLVAIFAIVVLAPYAMADSGPETITIDKIAEKMAPVEFKHAEHQKRTDGKCVTCHHKTEEGATPKACSACHGADEAAPSYKDTMHKICKDCHKEQAAAGKAAPTKCTGCHVKK